MASGTVKLFRIASEINIGKDAIVEFLQNKGFDVHNKPTTTLTDEMVDIVMEKFKREKKIAEVQREKLQKHKDVKQETKKPEKGLPPHAPSVDSRKDEILRKFDEAQKILEQETHESYYVKEEDDDYPHVKTPVLVHAEKTPKVEPVSTPKVESIVAPKAEPIVTPKVEIAAATHKKSEDHSEKSEHKPKVEHKTKPEKAVVDVPKVTPVSEKIIENKSDINLEDKEAIPHAKEKPIKEHSPKEIKKTPEIVEEQAPAYDMPSVGTVIDLKAINQKPDFDRRGNYVVKRDRDYDRRSDRSDNRGNRIDQPVNRQQDSKVNKPEDRADNRGNRIDNRVDRPDNRGDRPDNRGNRIDNRGDRPDNRPPRIGDNPDNRPPRIGDRPDNRPPRTGDRPDNRPPRTGDRPDNRGDRPDNRPPRTGDRPDNRGDRPDNRPPRTGDRPDNRPPRTGDRPDNRGDRPDNRPPRTGDRPTNPQGGSNDRNRSFDRRDDRNNQGGNWRQDPNRPRPENAPNSGAPNTGPLSDADRQRKKRKSIIQVGFGDQPRPDNRPDNRAPGGPGDRNRPPRFDDDKRRALGAANLPFEQPKIGGFFNKDADKSAKPKDAAKFTADRDERKKKKRKKSIRESISQEEVDRAIKATLTGMDTTSASSRAKIRSKKRAEREEKEIKIQEEKDRDSKVLQLAEFVTTSDIANLMGIPASEIIMKCIGLGLMVTINQRLDKETITLIADDYGFSVEFMNVKEIQFVEEDEDEESTLTSRPPIVTIMGHVDHGKTSLLDNIRHANVVAGEAGGITQHIGAYSVHMPDGRAITFLDTPGHEAFTAMRARGAQVTDIVVLVVAADDSVMPQTIEAISHAKAANVPIVVAINKMDKADANPDRIRQQLADYGVLVEEWGGKNQAVEISAKKSINLDQLLEKILLEAEILNLRANADRISRGTVIESHMNKGYGAVSSVIVQKGTLRVGDAFVSGIHAGKVRALLNERDHKVEFAGPSDPVRVIGCDGMPEAGDSFMVTETDAEARTIANQRMQMKREQELRQVRHVTLDDISAQILIGGVKDLNLIIKGDVAGSVEALSDSLMKLSRDEVRVVILHKGVGPITETDVMLGSASNAIIIGFNVIPTNNARRAADLEKVEIRNYNIIYDCIGEIQLALEGMLSPELKEEITSSVEIRRVYKISKLGSIAGCHVLTGKIIRNDKVRVMRNGFKIWEGGIESLKRGKDDVKEVDPGFECGIQLDGFNDVEENDIIEGFKIIEIKRRFK